MSVSNSGGVRAVNASSASPTIVLPSDVVAGDSIVLCVRTPTNETVVISSITDPVNGTWNLGTTLRQGPNDQTSATQRAWYFVLTNSAALTGAGNRTITVNYDGTISSQIVAAWFRSTLGALTFGAMATLLNEGSSVTNYDSNTAAASGAGVAVGFLATLTTQGTVPTCDGAGETNLNAADGASRSFLFNEAVASAGNYGFELTLVTATLGMLAVGTLIEPAISTPVITDVDTDEIVTSTQQNVVITGTDFSSAAVAVRDGSLSVAATIDSQNATTITADLGGVGTTTGIRYGSRVIRVTNSDTGFDDQAITLNPPSGVAYFQLSGTLAAGTSVAAYVTAQTYASGVPLTLTGGAASISPPRRVRITATTNESATNFAIVGSLNGSAQSETVAGPNNSHTVSSLFYDVITSITPNATEASDTIQVGADTLRLEASPDIANTHQIEVSLVLGTGMTIADVTINTDGTYTWTHGVEGFTWRSHNVTEGWGATAAITILVDEPPVITTAFLPDATIGIPYSASIEATGEGPFEFGATGLPSWASIDDQSGAISGTPDALGTTADIEFIVSNDHGDSAPVDLDLEVLPVAPVIITTTAPNGYVDHPYSHQLNASGGAVTLWEVSAGTLPNGLSLSAVTGLISGTPTVEVTPSVTFRATNDGGNDTQAINFTILAESAFPEGGGGFLFASPFSFRAP